MADRTAGSYISSLPSCLVKKGRPNTFPLLSSTVIRTCCGFIPVLINMNMLCLSMTVGTALIGVSVMFPAAADRRLVSRTAVLKKLHGNAVVTTSGAYAVVASIALSFCASRRYTPRLPSSDQNLHQRSFRWYIAGV